MDIYSRLMKMTHVKIMCGTHIYMYFMWISCLCHVYFMWIDEHFMCIFMGLSWDFHFEYTCIIFIRVYVTDYPRVYVISKLKLVMNWWIELLVSCFFVWGKTKLQSYVWKCIKNVFIKPCKTNARQSLMGWKERKNQ